MYHHSKQGLSIMWHFVSLNNCCAVILWINSSIKRGREAQTAQGEFLFYTPSFVETLNTARRPDWLAETLQSREPSNALFRDRSNGSRPWHLESSFSYIRGGRLGTEVLLAIML